LQGAGARSDVRGAKAQVALAEQAVRDDWLDDLPALGASFQPFVQTPGTVTTPTTGWQGQLVLSWSIFDGGYREGLHHERAARQASARADLDERSREALSEVRAARDQLDAAVDAQGEAEQSASAATEVLSLATRAYQAGASSNLEVVDAERDAHDAQARASMARDAVLQAKVALLSASGRFPG
jgi:outer membrane protein TolC